MHLRYCTEKTSLDSIPLNIINALVGKSHFGNNNDTCRFLDLIISNDNKKVNNLAIKKTLFLHKVSFYFLQYRKIISMTAITICRTCILQKNYSALNGKRAIMRARLIAVASCL